MAARGFGGDTKALHEALALAAIVAIAVHGAALLGDHFLHPTLLDISVPFSGGYRPLWTGIGIVAGWALAALGLSYYVRGWIGQSRWRSLHRFTAAFWALGIVHTLGAGTDAGQLWFMVLLVGTTAPAALLLAAPSGHPTGAAGEEAGGYPYFAAQPSRARPGCPVSRLAVRSVRMAEDAVRGLDRLSRADVAFAGGKGANLGELTAAGFPVPPGFVVGAPAYAAFCDGDRAAGADRAAPRGGRRRGHRRAGAGGRRAARDDRGRAAARAARARRSATPTQRLAGGDPGRRSRCAPRRPPRTPSRPPSPA